MRKFSHIKIIISGNIIEIIRFRDGFMYGQSPYKKAEISRNTIKKPSSIENRQRSIEDAQRRLKRLINANAGQWKDENGKIFMPIFLTLTFKENITDVKKANYMFTKFKQRIDYEITKKKKSYLKYAGIIEFQKRGAVHYHVLFFNMPFMEKI